MKDIIKWMRLHPLKSAGFAALFGFIPPFLASMPANWAWPGACFFLLCALVWGAVCHFDLRKVAVVLLVIALLAPVKAAEREPVNGGGVVIGIIVVCAGGVCVYKLVKFCQKKFPKDKAASTNDPPVGLVFNSNGGTGSGGGRSAAASNFGAIGSCGSEEQSELFDSDGVMIPVTLFTMDIRMDALGRVTTQTGAIFGTNNIQGWLDFQAEIATHGVQVTGVPGHTSYATNGVPCASEDVPIVFDEANHSVSIRGGDGPSRRCEVERSKDMINWSPFISVTVSREAGARIEDASASGVMFYRVRLSEVAY